MYHVKLLYWLTSKVMKVPRLGMGNVEHRIRWIRIRADSNPKPPKKPNNEIRFTISKERYHLCHFETIAKSVRS